MTAEYLFLAIVVAVTLNQASRAARVVGTLVAALGLAMIVVSVILADIDGTFAHMAGGFRPIKPLILNAQAAVATVAALFLVWAAWRQSKRAITASLSFRNTRRAYGFVSRYAHWSVAVLFLCLIPMGFFMAVLPDGAPERDMFTAVHESLGITVLVLVLLRLGWLMRSAAPPLAADLKPWERTLAGAIHPGLYVLMFGLPASGLLLVAFGGVPLDVYGWSIPLLPRVDDSVVADISMLHDWALPGVFFILIALHLAAVLTHHFVARRVSDVRRMLR